MTSPKLFSWHFIISSSWNLIIHTNWIHVKLNAKETESLKLCQSVTLRFVLTSFMAIPGVMFYSPCVCADVVCVWGHGLDWRASSVRKSLINSSGGHYRRPGTKGSLPPSVPLHADKPHHSMIMNINWTHEALIHYNNNNPWQQSLDATGRSLLDWEQVKLWCQ